MNAHFYKNIKRDLTSEEIKKKKKNKKNKKNIL